MRKLALASALSAALAAALAPPAAAAGSWTWPVRGPVLTPYRNGDDPYAAGQHRGIDIGAPAGTPVVAAAGGTVVYAGVVGSSGLTVGERTADGRFELSYLHLSAAGVRAGAHVSEGDRIGAVGTSGRRSVDEPHLHFGVREAGERQAYLDPLLLLAPVPPERPAPRPAPVAAPSAQPAHPAPVPAAAPALAPLPRLHPLGAPHAPPRHRPAHGPAANPSVAPRPHLLHSRAIAPARGTHAPGHAGSPQPDPSRTTHAPHRHGAPSLSLGGAPGHAPAPSAQATPARGTGPARSSGGLDLAWLAACVGLVAAAALLANPTRARAAARGSRTRVETLLRPLLRRG